MPYSRRNGVDIWYEVKGDGPAMVLVHANPFDNDLFMYQTAHFSTWFKVIAIDIRGYGRSTKMTTPYSIKDMADDVVHVMEDAGVSRAILGGVSVGSSIALVLGLDHPEKFDAIYLVGGSSGPSARFKGRIEGYRSGKLSEFHLYHLRDLVAPAFADSKLGKHLLNMWSERDPTLDGEAIAQVFTALSNNDTTKRLPSMTVPLLVINGELDNSLPGGAKTASLVPGAVHKIIAGAGHACNLEDPTTFDAIVIDFLRARGLMPKL
jgi:pimeloyl-ACP methyl ester carboxylesterase